MKSLKSILVAVSLFISIIGFAANVIPNNEGVNLYYNFNDELKLATLQPSEGDAYKGVINIPEQITFEGTTYDVATIATGAFKDCKDLTEVSIPKTITKIG